MGWPSLYIIRFECRFCKLEWSCGGWSHLGRSYRYCVAFDRYCIAMIQVSTVGSCNIWFLFFSCTVHHASKVVAELSGTEAQQGRTCTRDELRIEKVVCTGGGDIKTRSQRCNSAMIIMLVRFYLCVNDDKKFPVLWIQINVLVRLNFNTEPTSTEEVEITRLEEKMDSVTLPRGKSTLRKWTWEIAKIGANEELG